MVNSVALFASHFCFEAISVFEANSGNRESNRLRLEVGKFLDTVRAA